MRIPAHIAVAAECACFKIAKVCHPPIGGIGSKGCSQKDSTFHARLNAVHEADLFQGRLGFTKAIVLLEEGCEEFSNVHGLGQIRFPNGNIALAFEDIRRLLEREGLVQAQ